MGSNTNNTTTNDATTFQPSLCANACGFFGTAATNGYCSKCFQIKHQQSASAKLALNKLVNNNNNNVVTVTSSSSSGSEPVLLSTADQSVELKEKVTNRCLICNKKVGVIGFKCRCGDTFCGSHRYPEKHDCEFDFRKTGRDAIAKANPVVRADKVDRI
ncbi:hypothetical protein QVD17_28246 [Tagetes erecta]|uniref:Uncharacterized protein n=1 Tax=Tagetes erecta TaxID=13708 RepID=A0AAD8NRX1_TARER|nr:hypothetical protein QVD17_28246 [Tagetes erecta]